MYCCMAYDDNTVVVRFGKFISPRLQAVYRWCLGCCREVLRSVELQRERIVIAENIGISGI
jgi:hypothetical protein